jgi:hypothetical protein
MAFPVHELHSPFIKDVLLVSLDIPHNSAPRLCFTALFASTCVLNTLPFSISPCPVIGTTTSSFGQDYALGMILSSQLTECCSTPLTLGSLQWHELSPDRIDGVVVASRGSKSATPWLTLPREESHVTLSIGFELRWASSH